MKHRSAAERKELQLTFVSCPCYYIDQKAGRGAKPHSVSPILCQRSCHGAPAAACCHPWSGKWCTCHWRHFYSAVCDTGRGSSLCGQSRKNCPAPKQEEAFHLGKLIWARVLGEKDRKHSPCCAPTAIGLPHYLGAGTRIWSPRAARDGTQLNFQKYNSGPVPKS